MKLFCCTATDCKVLSAFALILISLAISSQAHAKVLKDWLYWNSYAELESYSIQAPDNQYESGADVSLASTGFDAYYGKWSGHIYGVYREGSEASAEIERVQLAWAPINWLTLSAGQNYLPFSYIDTLSVSYAPTASLGLTFRENITLSMHSEHFYFSAYTYKTNLKHWNLDLEEGATEDSLDHYGADFTITLPGNVLTLGASYMSNLGDSDLFAAVFPSAEYITEKTPVSAVYASLFWKRLGIIIETIEANNAFSEYEFYGYTEGLQPRATNAEIALYASPNSWALFGYRTTHEAEFTGLSAESYVLSYTNAFYNKRAHIGFEVNLAKSYACEHTGYRRLSTTGFAFKLALSY